MVGGGGCALKIELPPDAPVLGTLTAAKWHAIRTVLAKALTWEQADPLIQEINGFLMAAAGEKTE